VLVQFWRASLSFNFRGVLYDQGPTGSLEVAQEDKESERALKYPRTLENVGTVESRDRSE